MEAGESDAVESTWMWGGEMGHMGEAGVSGMTRMGWWRASRKGRRARVTVDRGALGELRGSTEMVLGNEKLDFPPQVDFEGSLAENRFTVLPNIDPEIDESECWV